MNKPQIKDKEVAKYVEYIESRLMVYEKSPYKDSYLALLNQINNWNRQLNTTPIDLFADSSQKEFDRAHKFFIEQKPYFEQLEYLRKLMTPLEQKEVAEKEKIKNLGIAEKIALGVKNE